jgi:DNA-binding transcriptional regulator LsrR (DeoR family)
MLPSSAKKNPRGSVAEGAAPEGPAPQGEASRQGSLAKVARLYYLEDMGQRQIAEKLGVSVASVSRSLARAKELGLVHISIDESSTASSPALEVEMERRFGLRECMIVPRLDSPELTYHAMAKAMGTLLSRVLKTGDILGVSWGETLKAIGEYMPRLSKVHNDVVPIIGAMGRIETGVYPNSIARSFAEKLGGSAYLINTPAIVDSPAIRQSVMKDSNFEHMRRLWRRLSAVVLGVSGLDADTSVYRGGIFTKTDLARMRARGGVCATNFSILDGQGREVATAFSDRILSLTLSEMKELRTVVLVAAGDAKVAPLRAALRGAFAHALVTDLECAKALLGDGVAVEKDRC